MTFRMLVLNARETKSNIEWIDNQMKQQDVDEFMALTQCSKQVALKYLTRNNGALNYALNDYYDSENGTFIIRSKPYPKELVEIFDKYKDEERDEIMVDGLIEFINDLSYKLEDITTLCLANMLQCTRLDEGISRDRFLSNWFEHECKTINQMKAVMGQLNEKLHNEVGYFSVIYTNTFDLILEENEKQLDINTAVTYWRLFFPETEQYAVKVEEERMRSWYDFIESNVTRVSRDVWQMFLMFITKFPDNVTLKQNYNEMDAWPFLIDEYYEFLEESGVI